MNVRTTLFASATVLALAVPALAGPFNKMTTICSLGESWCAYDTGGNLLGVMQQVNVLWRQINDKLYFIGYTAAGLTKDAAVYYDSSNCTGQAKVSSGYINDDLATATPDGPPFWARWDGTSFWADTGPTEVDANIHSWKCYGDQCFGNPEGVCLPTTSTVAPGYSAYAPAAIAETPHIAAPTAGCVANQSCMVIK